MLQLISMKQGYLFDIPDKKRGYRLIMVVYGFLNQALTNDEQDELDEWVAESDEHVLAFEQVLEMLSSGSLP